MLTQVRSVNVTRHVTAAALLVQAALLVACRQSPPGVQNTAGPALPEPVVPAGYQKIPPAAVDGGASMLAQTASVFRGVLKDVRFTYDDCGGPRTNYVFSDSSSLAGRRPIHRYSST